MRAEALDVAREMAAARDPFEMASSSGATFQGAADEGTFGLVFLGSEVHITWPGLELKAGSPSLPDHVLALLVYYLALSDGIGPEGRMVSFADLPDGRFYAQAFRGYTGAVLAREFAEEPEALERAAVSIGASALTGLADRAWRIGALPRVPLTLLWWDADDEFEARAEIMFDETAPHYLMTEGYAVLGSWLTSMLRGRRDS